MADESVGPGKGPFNLPASISTIYDQDATFWQIHALWREAEDAFETGPYYGDEPEGIKLANAADALRSLMFAEPISTVTALAAKFEAMEPGQESIRLTEGMTIIDVLRSDCRRLADIEATRG